MSDYEEDLRALLERLAAELAGFGLPAEAVSRICGEIETSIDEEIFEARGEEDQ